ncbi:hypothetical protein SprV_0301297300 [Sparganum proliferum]
MQEPSVSSTTCSPHKKASENQRSENSSEATTRKVTHSPKHETKTDLAPKKPASISSHRDSSQNRQRSKRRPHTCSKAQRKRRRSSYCRHSRRSRSRRRRSRRSHRSRSSSSRRRSSSTRRGHKHRRRDRSSSYSSPSRSSSRSSSSSSRSRRGRSPTPRPPPPKQPEPSRANSSMEATHKDTATSAEAKPSVVSPKTSTVTNVNNVPMSETLGSLPRLVQSNPLASSLLSLLMNVLNSPGQPPSSLGELIGLKMPGLLNPQPAPAVNPLIPLSATRQARRLYIGSIPPGMTSEGMMLFFNTEMRARGLCQAVGDPVIAVQVNSERHFSFIELRSVEEATAALNLDGVTYFGSSLRVRRPRDYVPPPVTLESRTGFAFAPSLSSNCVFVCGLPPTMPEISLQSMLSSFGVLKSCGMVKDPATGVSKGCGFFEYFDCKTADMVAAALHNLEIEDRKLFAIRADYLATACPSLGDALAASSLSSITKLLPTLESPAVDAPADPAATVTTPSVTEVPTMVRDEQQSTDALVGAETNTNQTGATEVLCLSNMITPADIESPEDYTDVFDDVRTECLRHGKVKSMQMPRPVPGVNVPGVGCIFVEFVSIKDAMSASNALSGRQFNGRIVVTNFFDPIRYQKQEF